MNIIPSTPETAPKAYTIIGGQGKGLNDRALLPFAIMVLHRNNSYDREAIFDRLHRLNAKQVLSIETGNPHYDIEAYTGAYREFKFMIMADTPASTGELINIAMGEIQTPLVLVLWSDAILLPVSRAYLDEFEASANLYLGPYCRTPDNALLPSLYAPGSSSKSFQILSFPPSPERRATLFPYQYMGLYRLDAFLQSGGFDPNIHNPWWQKLDFGLRARLWGYRLEVTPGLRLQIPADLYGEDTSPGQDYGRFYGKNLLPEFKADHGAVSLRRFWHYHRASNADLAGAWREFKALSAWVYKHRYRFKTEAKSVVEFWEREDELYP